MSTGEPRLLQYFKTVFLKIQNVTTWSVFTNSVTLVTRRTNAHANVDVLSQLPLTDTIQETPIPAELVLTM